MLIDVDLKVFFYQNEKAFEACSIIKNTAKFA